MKQKAFIHILWVQVIYKTEENGEKPLYETNNPGILLKKKKKLWSTLNVDFYVMVISK